MQAVPIPQNKLTAQLQTAAGDPACCYVAVPEGSPSTFAIATPPGAIGGGKYFRRDRMIGFVVMPFSIEPLTIVFEEFVRPTLKKRCRLRVERGDDMFGSNAIVDDVIAHIARADIVIADLTGRNPNVLYETGLAHALRKPVLLMSQSIDDVPFDLRHRRVLLYDYSPRGCKRLEKDLALHVRAMIAG